MRFFIPKGEWPDDAPYVYASIKSHLTTQSGVAEFSGRKIRALQWVHEGTKYEAEVGKPTAFNDEQVVAILYEPRRNLYHVCTENRGVLRGESILAGDPFVKGWMDFIEEE